MHHLEAPETRASWIGNADVSDLFRSAANSVILAGGGVDRCFDSADVAQVAVHLTRLPAVPPVPFGLFLDVDGTLVDLAPRPDAVVVPDDLKATLKRLAARLDGAVALVSGRSVADLDALFDPVRLRASGVHGTEWRLAPAAMIEHAQDAALPPTIAAAVQDIAAAHPGTLVEDKRFSVAIHYRAAPEAGPALCNALETLVGTSQQLRVLAGHRVYEVKHAGFDKGKAIERFMAHAPFKGRRPVFIGDDVTDEPGFAAAVAKGGIACAVGGERPGATHEAATPGDVRAWLARLADHPDLR